MSETQLLEGPTPPDNLDFTLADVDDEIELKESDSKKSLLKTKSSSLIYDEKHGFIQILLFDLKSL